MPALKYWDGLQWQRLQLQGSAPGAPAVPPVRGQPGTVLAAGTANIPDINTAAGGLYDLASYLDGFTYGVTTVTHVVAAFWTGYGGSDTAFQNDIWALGPNALAASVPGNVFAHAAYWAAVPLVAAWQCPAGQNVGFKLRVNYVSGSNIHTGGGVNYIVLAV